MDPAQVRLQIADHPLEVAEQGLSVDHCLSALDLT
jgi:hypothetical protein